MATSTKKLLSIQVLNVHIQRTGQKVLTAIKPQRCCTCFILIEPLLADIFEANLFLADLDRCGGAIEV